MRVLGEAGILANQSPAIVVIFQVMFNVFGAIIGVHSHTALAIINLAVVFGPAWRYGASLGLEQPRRERRA